MGVLRGGLKLSAPSTSLASSSLLCGSHADHDGICQTFFPPHSVDARAQSHWRSRPRSLYSRAYLSAEEIGPRRGCASQTWLCVGTSDHGQDTKPGRLVSARFWCRAHGVRRGSLSVASRRFRFLGAESVFTPSCFLHVSFPRPNFPPRVESPRLL